MRTLFRPRVLPFNRLVGIFVLAAGLAYCTPAPAATAAEEVKAIRAETKALRAQIREKKAASQLQKAQEGLQKARQELQKLEAGGK